MEPPHAIASRAFAGHAGDPPDRSLARRSAGVAADAADPPDGPPSILRNVCAHSSALERHLSRDPRDCEPATGDDSASGSGDSNASFSSDFHQPSRGFSSPPLGESAASAPGGDSPWRDRRVSSDTDTNSCTGSEANRANGWVREGVTVIPKSHSISRKVQAALRRRAARRGYLRKNAQLLAAAAGLVMVTHLLSGTRHRTGPVGGTQRGLPHRGLVGGIMRDEPSAHDPAARSGPSGWISPGLRGYYAKMLGIASEEAKLSPAQRMRQQEQLIIQNRMEAQIFEAQQNAMREIARLGEKGGEGPLAAQNGNGEGSPVGGPPKLLDLVGCEGLMSDCEKMLRLPNDERAGDAAGDSMASEPAERDPPPLMEEPRERSPPAQQELAPAMQGAAPQGLPGQAPPLQPTNEPREQQLPPQREQAPPETELPAAAETEAARLFEMAGAQQRAAEEERRAALGAAAAARVPEVVAARRRAEEEEQRVAVTAAEARARATLLLPEARQEARASAPPLPPQARKDAPLATESPAAVAAEAARRSAPEEDAHIQFAELETLREERLEELPPEMGPPTEVKAEAVRPSASEEEVHVQFVELEKPREERLEELPAEGERRLQKEAVEVSARNPGLGIPTRGGRPV